MLLLIFSKNGNSTIYMISDHETRSSQTTFCAYKTKDYRFKKLAPYIYGLMCEFTSNYKLGTPL